jgi:RNA exonuclease 1
MCLGGKVNSNDESNGTEHNTENSQQENHTGNIINPKKKKRNRRRRRRRQNDSLQIYQNDISTIETSPSSDSSREGNSSRGNIDNTPVIYRFQQHIAISETDLSGLLRHYILSPDQLLPLGYPVESLAHPGCAVTYNDRAYFTHFHNGHDYYRLNPYAKEFQPTSVFEHFQTRNTSSFLDPDANEFVPRHANHLMETYVHCSDGQQNKSQRLDSARDEKTCARCGSSFFVTKDGKYLTQEHCIYHWGKIQRAVAPDTNCTHPARPRIEYSCCRGQPNTRGCTTANVHVWDGLQPGINGPLLGYVRTSFTNTSPPHAIYALDCEMCYTTHGLEVIRVTLVAADGTPVYDSLVRPEHCVIDYNTRFSGITESDLSDNETKSLQEVQNDLMYLINADTILVGHGLGNDLRGLRIIHNAVVDTSVIFPHERKLPYRRSLKSLVSSILNKEIQQGSCGHCSFEDASACIDLMLWKIKEDFFTILQTQAPHFILVS